MSRRRKEFKATFTSVGKSFGVSLEEEGLGFLRVDKVAERYGAYERGFIGWKVTKHTFFFQQMYLVNHMFLV